MVEISILKKFCKKIVNFLSKFFKLISVTFRYEYKYDVQIILSSACLQKRSESTIKQSTNQDLYLSLTFSICIINLPVDPFSQPVPEKLNRIDEFSKEPRIF